jgi:transposase InsO family protein
MFSRVGVPKELLTDQGSNFMSDLIKQVCKLLKINKLCTTPYHPEANGLVENFNGVLPLTCLPYINSNGEKPVVSFGTSL